MTCCNDPRREVIVMTCTCCHDPTMTWLYVMTSGGFDLFMIISSLSAYMTDSLESYRHIILGGRDSDVDTNFLA